MTGQNNQLSDKDIRDLLKWRLLEQDGEDDLLTQKLLDMETKLVFGNEALLMPSSQKENELLKMLCEYKNDLLPRDAALKKIWGSDTYFNGRSMDVYIAKLRKYLKDDPKLEIVNIHGNGFRLVVQES